MMKMRLNNAEKLLISLSKIEPSADAQLLSGKLIKNGLDWEYICGRALDEGVGPLLYKNLKNLNLLSQIPTSHASFLKKTYYSTLAKNMLMMKELQEAVELLGGYGIKVLLTQGICLLETIYKDIGLRPLEDLDIIIRKNDIASARAALIDAGFSPAPNYPDILMKGDIALDIHSDFFNYDRIESRRFAFSVDVDEVFARAGPDFNTAGAALRPAPEDLFIILALHAMKHSFSRLIWFVDLAELSRELTSMGGWDELWSRADSFNAQKPVLYVISYLRNAMGLDIPQSAPEKIISEKLGLMERQFLRMLLAAGRLDRSGDLWLLFSIGGKREMARLLLEIAFPKREIMGQIYPSMPPKLMAVSYLLRFFQIFGFLSKFLLQAFKQMKSLRDE